MQTDPQGHTENLMKRLVPGILAVLMLAACAKDDTLVYNERDMVLINDGKLLTDNGITFTIAEDGTTSEWKSWQRAYITCDVLRQTAAAEYEIRLTEAHKVLLKEALTHGQLPEEEIGDDPIDILYGWVAGDYLNLFTRIAYDPASDRAHFLNLVYLGEADRVLRFRLRHNSYGYYYGAPDVEGVPNFGIAYVTFPIGRFLPESQAAAEVEISWEWHTVSAGGVLLPETEEYSRRIILRR